MTILNIFFQMLQGITKECSVHIRRLSERQIRMSIVAVEEIKIEEHDDINDQIYSNSVSQFILRLFVF